MVDRVQQRPECRAMDGTPSLHPCGQDMTGPRCTDWGGPCDQGLRTEVCGLVWNQIHFWIHCAPHSQLHPPSCLPLLVRSYSCSTWRAPWCYREKGQSGQVARPALSMPHVLPFPAGPETPSCLSHLSPFTNAQPPPQDPLPMEQDGRESTVVWENPAN